MTDRQRAFLAAYLAGPRRTATSAAEAAGYRWPDKQGPRLTHFTEIAALIRADDERRASAWKAVRRAMRPAEREAARKRQREWVPPKGYRGAYKRRRWV